MSLSFGETYPQRCLITNRAIPHFIVPYGYTRYICIMGQQKDIEAEVSPVGRIEVRKTTFAENSELPIVEAPHRWFRIDGDKRGRTNVVFKHGRDRLKLKVDCYPWRLMHVNFFLVTDSHGTPTFNASGTHTHINRLDRVYRPQACIDFHRHLPTKAVSVSIDCSRRMNEAQENRMWDAFQAKVPTGSRGHDFFNIFVVKAWGGHDNSASGYNAWATSNGGLIVIDDVGIANATPVVPHEVGHSMGLEHSATAGYVMRQGSRKGWKLTWNEVKTVRGYVS